MMATCKVCGKECGKVFGYVSIAKRDGPYCAECFPIAAHKAGRDY